MNEISNIITERVDDIPLLIEQMQRMGLPTLFDDHFPTHGNWTGLSLGWVSTIWLSSMLSRGDHRMVHVEPWVVKRLWTLRVTTSQAVRRVTTQGSTCTMRWSPRDNMELSQIVLTQPKLRPVQLPWVGKWVSNNVGRPIRCICSINSEMSSTRSVMMWGISFMPRA